jgi:hypothetical protein
LEDLKLPINLSNVIAVGEKEDGSSQLKAFLLEDGPKLKALLSEDYASMISRALTPFKREKQRFQKKLKLRERVGASLLK